MVNHFAALEITDAGIKHQATGVQADIIQRFPNYKTYVVQPNGFHLTLGIFHLEDEEREACLEVMRRLKHRLLDLAKRSAPVAIKGVGYFGSKVAYADVVPTKEFLEISELIKMTLDEEGLRVDLKPSHPHLTLFKATGRAHLMNLEEVIHPYKGVDFGRQKVDNIQVCQMGSLRNTGFYRSIFHLG